MLAAFVLVIALGIGGMVGLYRLAVPEGRSEAPIASPLMEIERKYTGETLAPAVVDDGDSIRGFVSAGLALAAVLLGAATFFSSRVSRPLSRLTHAARAMAAGDLSVRVGNCAVREINELSQAFNTMAASIAGADQQRRQLTADVAHELRTPLSIIRGRLEGLQDGVYDATPEQIAVLLDETAQLERLIEDLRLLALADAGQLPLYRTALRPERLLHEVERSFSHQALTCGVTLSVRPGIDLPAMQADPQRLEQVLDNLVGNALRYTPAGGAVVVSAWNEAASNGSPRVGIAVADTGIGISEQDLPHVFDRFYRADRARSRSSGGAGLGLAIAKRIVDAHGGRIWAHSTPGHGTMVAFSLPGETEEH
jgi:signal transduction histidine kinase